MCKVQGRALDRDVSIFGYLDIAGNTQSLKFPAEVGGM